MAVVGRVLAEARWGEIETLARRVDRLLGPAHAAERVIGASALVTVLLSAIGLYGLLSLVAALLAGRGLAHHLYEIEPRDPATLAAAVALFALVAAVAAWWPARRAARVDPAVTLRQG